MDGYAIQCRVTTEDPKNNFAPDNGKITAYRSGGGFGVRLDGGNAAAGAEISPYYDSLLVKVTTWDRTFEAVCRKAAPRHQRGARPRRQDQHLLRHQHPEPPRPSSPASCHTKFIDETPELFDIDGQPATGPRKRAAATSPSIQVQNPDAERREYHRPALSRARARGHAARRASSSCWTPRARRRSAKWVLAQKKLLITDTTMRDAHQSLLSTRMRTRDMVKGAEGTAEILADCFSLEMWGGATFDTAYRFLHESPWERLDHAAGEDPQHPLPDAAARRQRSSATPAIPDNLVRAFIEESAKSGIDVFRVFDSLNWIPGMEIAMDEPCSRQGKLLRGHRLLHRRHPRPQAGQVHAQILRGLRQGAGDAAARTRSASRTCPAC